MSQTTTNVLDMKVHEAPEWWVISDIHSCYQEFVELLNLIKNYSRNYQIAFVGDYIDRGPFPAETLGLVRELIGRGAVGVMGNHDWKAYRATILERNVQQSHGLKETLANTSKEMFKFMGDLPRQLHLKVPGNSEICTVVHAGLPYDGRGKSNKFYDNHALYGETQGFREDGFPIRSYDWVHSWEGQDGICVFGHDRVDEVLWKTLSCNVVSIDTGCAFGGKLTAYNPFTEEVLEVEAERDYTQEV